jgi:hypothetical protein
MKKYLILIIVLQQFIYTVGQRPPGITNTVISAHKDTSRPGIRPPASSVVNSPEPPVNSLNSSLAASATGISPTLTNNKPLTLEELNKRILDLESQLNSVKNKLPFQNMAVMMIEATEKNMEAGTGDFPFFKHHIRIDNPLSNNNPKAIVLAMNLGDKDKMQTVNAFYNSKDNYWYISVPQLKLSGFEFWGIREGSKTARIELEIISYSSFEHSQGVAFAKPSWPNLGQKFSVIIFNELPVFRQGINNIKNN